MEGDQRGALDPGSDGDNAAATADGLWHDDREDAEPFDPAQVVWAPTPQIRQSMLAMRKKAR